MYPTLVVKPLPPENHLRTAQPVALPVALPLLVALLVTVGVPKQFGCVKVVKL
jgi:hypothetical protein